jgi:hypothetical protein
MIADRNDTPVSIEVNGTSVSAAPDPMGYVSLSRAWKDRDVVRVVFPVEIRRVVADARVTDNRRRLAIERGPIVYCSEWPEAPAGRVLDLRVDLQTALQPSIDAKLDGGATVIRARASTSHRIF